MAKSISESFSNVANALGQLELAEKTAQEVTLAAVKFRPIHKHVRALQRDAKTIDRAIVAIVDRIEDLPEDSSKISGLNAQIDVLNDEKAVLLAQVPADWDATYKEYQEINKAQSKAFSVYKRLSSDAYVPAIEALGILNSGDAFRNLKDALLETKAMVTQNAPADSVEPLADLSRAFNDVAGAGAIKSAISKARRAVKSKTPNKEKAQKQLDKAIALYQDQTEWRAKAEADIAPKLAVYTDSLRTTLGLKDQQDFTREQALFVASCVSDHRDVSLNF